MSDWTTPATIIALIAALGVGNLAPKAVAALWKLLTSRAKRERAEVDQLRATLKARDLALDIESAYRRRLQEALSQTRIVAAEHGVPMDKLPAFPGRPDPTEGVTP